MGNTETPRVMRPQSLFMVVLVTLGFSLLAAQRASGEDFDLTITASSTNGGYEYNVSATAATGVEPGWWYFVVVEFPNADKTSNDQKDGADGDKVDGEIKIDSTKCGQTNVNQRRAYEEIMVKLYRCKKANSFDTREGPVAKKAIRVTVVD